MAKLKIRSKDLRKINFPNGKPTAIAMGTIQRHYKQSTKEEVIEILLAIQKNPSSFLKHPIFAKLAEVLYEQKEVIAEKIDLLPNPQPYQVFGSEYIGQGAKDQLELALKLPIAVQGAIMPDGHFGYGLPVGGVLATKNAVIPYGVGVDIGCRMSLSIYPINPSYLENQSYELKKLLKENTRFGKRQFDRPLEDPIIDRAEFQSTALLRRLKDKAWRQLGSSGSGNHFVEFGTVEITEVNNPMELPLGQYMALLTHSGSRGFGATIANHFTDIAKKRCNLPKMAQNLSYLSLDSHEGQSYWLAMNLAGDYAKACHDQIHRRMADSLGFETLVNIENHHNFAWKEQWIDGTEIIVHRKGSTPAHEGELGIIPGTMTDPGFIVSGKGYAPALNSAAHGAGRQLSRTKAKASLTKKTMQQILKKAKVDLIGGGLDEAPVAYKNIHKVMEAQTDLVNILGTFSPKYVRMDKS